jgi:chorismate dehydratase
MLFGSIEYLNLLPFQVFLKKYLKNSPSYQSLVYKRDVPSKINIAFANRRVNAAFISSVKSKGCRCTNLGIIAKKDVKSVFLIEGINKIDSASASSNQLAKILGLNGEVIIGDRALKYHLNGGDGIDLARAWYDKYGLPFVFARLCYNKNGLKIERLADKFIKVKIKIPQYILKKEAKKRSIKVKELLWYLDYIHYSMDYSSKKSLKIFLRGPKK